MLKYSVRCFAPSTAVSVIARRPTAVTPLMVSRPLSTTPAAATGGVSSWFKVKVPETSDNGIPAQKEHAKGRDLEEVEANLRGEIRFAMGQVGGPFGTFANPSVITSANPERVVGCLGDGAEYEHSLLWMMVKDNGKKHMCQACGQFFVLQRDPSGAAAPIH